MHSLKQEATDSRCSPFRIHSVALFPDKQLDLKKLTKKSIQVALGYNN